MERSKLPQAMPHRDARRNAHPRQRTEPRDRRCGDRWLSHGGIYRVTACRKTGPRIEFAHKLKAPDPRAAIEMTARALSREEESDPRVGET